jgi:inosine-uridine nucleoside N-ribohydrolase
MISPVIFDMETNDPDDMFALFLLGSHPDIKLVAVTVNPGTRQQIGVVRHILALLGLEEVPVGARNPDSLKDAVSAFHYEFLGDIRAAEPDTFACELLAEYLTRYPEALLITGAPLHNLRLLLSKYPQIRISKWFGQGGFAGDSIVHPEDRLQKFEGLETCLSFNFNGDPKGAKLALKSEQILEKFLVSKNVCHGIIYDISFHEKMRDFKDSAIGLEMIFKGMGLYLGKNPDGKIFHDPLTTCIAINPSIATFEAVEIYQKEGKWGSKKSSLSNTFITVKINKELFFETFTSNKVIRN